MYRFVYVATNAFGDSEFSLHLIAGLGALPTLSAAPSRDTEHDLYSKDNSTMQMMITWASLTTTSDLDVLGFALSVDDGLDNDD
mmetsp:Transcript_23476/g.36168  ORF Transcript_23476/g.36168 Transcript_23476/m.36168 type:complete len:84 (-) Transcript_23476:4224-4475(-)